MARGALTAVATLAALGPPHAASADRNDLVMSRLATRITGASGDLSSVVGENLEFRALASQLGVVLAPQLLTPADTLGFAGFQFDATASQTSIDSKQPYWRVLAGSPDPSGTNRIAHGAGVLRTVGVFAHKGLWLPAPSFELGVGAIHLLESATWAVQAYAQLGVHEGYHDLAIPSVALRGAVSRMMNQRELDLTIVSIDLTVSKHFVVADTWRIDPFAGFDVLAIIPRSGTIDATPDVDPLQPGNEMDAANNFAFRDQSAIYRNRLLVGGKLQYDILQLTVEGQLALAGSSSDDRAAGMAPCQASSTTSNCAATDIAAAQATISVSAGFDF